MSPSEIIVALDRYGCRLSVDGDRIVVRGPGARMLPDELKQAISARKPEILELLQWDDDRAEAVLKESLAVVGAYHQRRGRWPPGIKQEFDKLEECWAERNMAGLIASLARIRQISA